MRGKEYEESKLFQGSLGLTKEDEAYKGKE